VEEKWDLGQAALGIAAGSSCARAELISDGAAGGRALRLGFEARVGVTADGVERLYQWAEGGGKFGGWDKGPEGKAGVGGLAGFSAKCGERRADYLAFRDSRVGKIVGGIGRWRFCFSTRGAPKQNFPCKGKRRFFLGILNTPEFMAGELRLGS